MSKYRIIQANQTQDVEDTFLKVFALYIDNFFVQEYKM